MSAMVSQITSLVIVHSTVYSGTDERKHQSSTSLAFVREIHQWPVNSPHKRPVTRKLFPFDDVIMACSLMGFYERHNAADNCEQGKSEGFESCGRPIVRKRPIWVKIGDVLYRVTLKFDGWPWKTIGHLSFAVSSFVQHFIAIGEFKLELQSGNAQFGSNSTIFRAMWPCNLTYDLEKQ